LGTKPRMPTMSIVRVQIPAAVTTTIRRPNLSVNRISEIDVIRAMIAVLPQVSISHTGKRLYYSVLRMVVIKNGFSKPLCLKNKLA
jgi:hypothetical protein